MATHLWRLVLAAGFAVGVAACGGKPSAEAVKTCEKAAERYITCLEETMGKEAADLARSKKGGIEACAKDKRTVDFYRDKCLPKKTCEEFMDCTMDLAMQEP